MIPQCDGSDQVIGQRLEFNKMHAESRNLSSSNGVPNDGICGRKRGASRCAFFVIAIAFDECRADDHLTRAGLLLRQAIRGRASASD